MLAATHVTRALHAILQEALKSGRIPSRQAIASALAVKVPDPLAPSFVVDPVTPGSTIDSTRYNAVWGALADDLTTLYTATYETLMRVSTLAEQLVSQSSTLSALVALADEAITQYDVRDTTCARISETFHTSAAIDPTTTAAIDYTNGIATLPVDVTTLHPIDVSDVLIQGVAVTGTEQPMRFAPLARMLDAVDQHAWMTQVIGPGGGATYVVTLTFPEPRVLTRVEVIPTHQQTIDLEGRSNDVWSTIPPQGTITVDAIRITLQRVVGLPVGDGTFLYTFGIRRVDLGDAQYQLQSSLVTLPRVIQRGNRAFSRITLRPNETLPPQTAITYKVSLTREDTTTGTVTAVTDANGDAITARPVMPGRPLLVGSSQIREEELTPTDVVRVGRGLRTATLSGNVLQSLRAQGNGIFCGDAQWRVDAYEHDWTYTTHKPGPADWSVLPNGVFPEEVVTSYSDIFRSNTYKAYRRCDVLTTTLAPQTTYRFLTHVYCTEPHTRIAPAQIARSQRARDAAIATDRGSDGSASLFACIPDILTGQSQLGTSLQIVVYLNGRAVSPTDTGMSWAFVGGWNTIAVYLSTTRDFVMTQPIGLGVSLTPAALLDWDLSGSLDSWTYGNYPTLSDGTPDLRITALRARQAPLDLVSEFDLLYNTPILYHERVGVVITSTRNTQVWLPSVLTRVVARYDTEPTGSWATTDEYSLQLTAVLSTTPLTTDVRPLLQGYDFLVE